MQRIFYVLQKFVHYFLLVMQITNNPCKKRKLSLIMTDFKRVGFLSFWAFCIIQNLQTILDNLANGCLLGAPLSSKVNARWRVSLLLCCQTEEEGRERGNARGTYQVTVTDDDAVSLFFTLTASVTIPSLSPMRKRNGTRHYIIAKKKLFRESHVFWFLRLSVLIKGAFHG